jgi:hypothetical protein
MICIVPLAGPDFYDERYGIKPLYKIQGEALIKKAIESRPWYLTGELMSEDIIFVLRETQYTSTVVDFLSSTFVGCKFVTIPEITKGALMTTLAGISIIRDYDVPVVVDLVDIIYDQAISPKEIFENDIRVGGILPYFNSKNEKYSYMAIENGFVNRTAEKEVISNHASAGTYFYRNLDILLKSFADSVANEGDYSVRGNLFLCPSYNGIISNNMLVYPVQVSNVDEISLNFHE